MANRGGVDAALMPDSLVVVGFHGPDGFFVPALVDVEPPATGLTMIVFDNEAQAVKVIKETELKTPVGEEASFTWVEKAEVQRHSHALRCGVTYIYDPKDAPRED